MRGSREEAFELLGRASVGTLYLLLSFTLLHEFLRTEHLTGLLLLVSESLVVVLTVVRRRALAVDRSAAARGVILLALLGPALVRPAGAVPITSDGLTALITAIGVCLVIAGKLALGRSFGVIPANRGVVISGPYALVRHPIYAGYLLAHVGFVAAHPSWWNIVMIVAGDTALVVRALFEERVLQRDQQYREYCGRVGWHLVPGIF